MTIDEWARRESVEYAHGDVYGEIEPAFRDGAMTLANALLSDEAAEAAARAIGDDCCEEHFRVNRGTARTAIQAAIDAVTKGDTE